MCSKSGAPAAFRGYRLQSLYIIKRILEGKKEYIYSPEKSEDLTIIDNESGEVIEDIQVKAHSSSNLSLSNFKIDKQDSFFRRILKYKSKNKSPEIKIVSFDKVGSELLNAFNEKKEDAIKSIRRKLKDKKFISDEIDYIFSVVSIVEVDEENILSDIKNLIKDIPMACSVETVFDNLNAWIYRCSENRININIDELNKRIINIGENSNPQTFFKKHFTSTIKLLKDNNRLHKEDDFYKGSLTRFTHITNNLDIIREDLLKEINEQHNKNNIIIIHGASGEGKTTLAYRYMYEYFAEGNRFEIADKSLENYTTVGEIASCIKGFSRNKDYGPVGFYIDVSPAKLGWLELLRELTVSKNIFVVVTIREEDWRRSSLENYELSFEELSMSFSKEEARKFYENFVQKNNTSKYMNFEESWNLFGGKGPLLEYSYFLNNNITLKKRLKAQVDRIINEKDEVMLEVLEIIALASIYDSRISVKKLSKIIGRRKHIINYLEKEYLIIENEDECTIEGLHFVRSRILVELLIEDDSFIDKNEVILKTLNFLDSSDYKDYLHNVFFYEKDTEIISEYVINNNDKFILKWKEAVGVFQALMWLGVNEYVKENLHVIKSMYDKYGKGWLFIADFDIANAAKGDLMENIFDTFNLDISKFDKYREQFTVKENILKYIKRYDIKLNYEYLKFEDANDWKALGYLGVIIGHFELESKIKSFVEEMDFEKIKEIKANIEEISDTIIGLYYLNPNKTKIFCENNYQVLIDKFREERNILKVENNIQNLKIYKFLSVDLFEKNNKSLNENYNEHQAIIRDIYTLRKLYPYKMKYSSESIGTNIIMKSINLDTFDDTKKDIPVENLLIDEITQINGLFRGIVNNTIRPCIWKDFLDEHLKNRIEIKDFLSKVNKMFVEYFKKNKYMNLLNIYRKTLGNNNQLQDIRNMNVLLPKLVIDRFGYIDESTDGNKSESGLSNRTEKKVPMLNKYYLLKKSLNNYYSAINNFINNFHNAFLFKIINEKDLSESEKGRLLNKLNHDTHLNWISLVNINDARKEYITFKKEYDKLFRQTTIYDSNKENKIRNEELDEINKAISLWSGILENCNVSYWNFSEKHSKKIKSFNDNLKENIENIISEYKINESNVEYTRLEDERTLLIEYSVKRIDDIENISIEILDYIFTEIKSVSKGTQLFLDIDYYINNITIIPKLNNMILNHSIYHIPIKNIYFSGDNFNLLLYTSNLDRVGYKGLDQNLEILEPIVFDKYHQILVIMKYLRKILDIDEEEKFDEMGENFIEKYISENKIKEYLSNNYCVFLNKIVEEINDIITIAGGLIDSIKRILDFIDKYGEEFEITNEFILDFEKLGEDIYIIEFICLSKYETTVAEDK